MKSRTETGPVSNYNLLVDAVRSLSAMLRSSTFYDNRLSGERFYGSQKN